MCIANSQTTGFVNRRFTAFSTVSDECASTITGAKVYVGQHTCGDTLANEDGTSSSGEADQRVLQNKYHKVSTTFTTDTFGEFDLHWVDYGKVPQQRALTIENNQDFPITLLDDDDSVATEGCAVVDGNVRGRIFIDATNPHSIIKWTAGCGTLTEGKYGCGGDVVTGGTSTADGVLMDIIEGCLVAGTGVLRSRDGNSFTAAGETITTSCWSATLTACSEQRFRYLL